MARLRVKLKPHHDVAHLHLYQVTLPSNPTQDPYQVTTSYTYSFLEIKPTLKVMVITTRSKFQSQSHHYVAHLYPLNNVPTKYHLPYLTVFKI